MLFLYTYINATNWNLVLQSKVVMLRLLEAIWMTPLMKSAFCIYCSFLRGYYYVLPVYQDSDKIKGTCNCRLPHHHWSSNDCSTSVTACSKVLQIVFFAVKNSIFFKVPGRYPISTIMTPDTREQQTTV